MLLKYFGLVLGLLIFTIGKHLHAQPGQAIVDLGIPPNIAGERFSNKSSMLVDHENNLWIGAGGPGIQYNYGVLVKRTPQGNWETYTDRNSGLPNSVINDLHHYDSTLYVATGRGLARFNGEWEVINTSHGLPSHIVYSVFADATGVFAGTAAGLSILPIDSIWIHYTTDNSPLLSNKVQVLLKEKAETLWIGTDKGLQVLIDGVWQTIASEELNIQALEFDLNNDLWVGTAGDGGLYKLDNGQLIRADLLLGYSFGKNTVVRSIARDSNGSIYTSVQLNDMPQYWLINIHDGFSWLYQYNLSSPIFHFWDNALHYTLNPIGNFFRFNLENALMHHNHNFININNICTRLNAGGRLGWSVQTNPQLFFETPTGSGKHTLFTQTLWIAGTNSEKRKSTSLHLAAEHFNLTGYDYWPGPMASDQEIYFAIQHDWNRVWKLNRSSVEHHKTSWHQPDYIMPPEITQWPAHAQPGSGDFRVIAPFHDINNNGIYEPELGEYPKMRGDQTLFFISNDHRFDHAESGGIPLGIEIKGMVYGFNTPENEALYHTLFLNFMIQNQSENVYDDVHLSVFNNFGIGYSWDDYVGSDTSLHAYYGFNGTAVDGSGQPEAYGHFPPALGVSFLNKSLSSFMLAKNSTNPIDGLPRTAHEFYNYMQAKWRNGTPLTFGNTGFEAAPGSAQRTYHIFSGDLNEPGSWTEFTAVNGGPTQPGNRSGIGSTYVGMFMPGETICFDLALVYARDEETAWPNGSVNLLKDRIQSVREFFYENIATNCEDFMITYLPPIGERTSPVLRCFPNPACSFINMVYEPAGSNCTYLITDLTGRKIKSGPVMNSITRINLDDMAPGFYVASIVDKGGMLTQKFIKK
jgi:hypothetical protein